MAGRDPLFILWEQWWNQSSRCLCKVKRGFLGQWGLLVSHVIGFSPLIFVNNNPYFEQIPFVASFCHNTFALMSMLLHQVKSENGHKRWLLCVQGVDRILITLEFVSTQLSQSFFFKNIGSFLATAALSFQVLWICRRMPFIHLLLQRAPPLVCLVIH